MKILYRYILREVLKFFLLFSTVFILIMLMNKASFIAKSILGYGVSFSSIFSVLIKTIPSFFEFLIPVALVFSILVAFFIFSNRNEIVAVKSCGISVKELSKPIVFLSLLLVVLNFFSVMYLVPSSNVAVKREIEQLVRKKLSIGIIPGKFTSNFPGVTFYAKKVYPEKGFLEDFMISVTKKREKATIFAKFGKIRMENGTVYLDIGDGVGQFFNWDRPQDLKLLKFKRYTLLVYKFMDRETFGASKYKALNELIERWNKRDRAEFFKRLTLSLAPLIVGLFAFSIAVTVPRGSVGTGILLGLVIIIGYYVLFTFLRKVAQSSGPVFLPIFVDLFFGIGALTLYRWAIKEKYLNFGSGRW